MKKLILLFVLLSSTAFAQTKFIEVAVKDTVTLQPAILQCNVFIKTNSKELFGNFNDDDENTLVKEENIQNQLQELKSKLEAKNYITEPLQDSGESFFGIPLGKFPKQGFTVIVNGTDEVKRLKEMVGKLGYAGTSVSVLKYADETGAEELLIKKIIDKAKTRAKVLAGYSALKAGEIIEITEIDESEDFVSSMKKMQSEALKIKDMENGSNDYSGTLSKGFRIKFAVQ